MRGSLTLLFTEQEATQQRLHVEKQRERGMEVHFLDREAALRLEPAVSPDSLGAVYAPADGTANPYATTLAVARAAKQLGADVRTGVEVLALKAEGGRIATAVTPAGEITGDKLVLAAGAWSPLLTRPLGLNIPVEPSRGQIMVTEPLGLTTRTVKDTGHIYLCPTERGNLVIGSMTEKVGFDKRLTREKMSAYLHDGARLMPSVGSARIVRGWAGLRPLSPDNLPLLGEAPGYEGLVLAVGHSRLGILLSAATCKITADFALGITPGFATAPFNPARFTFA